MLITIPNLQQLRESEDSVEFKAARNNYPYKGGNHSDPKDRRKCVLGYCVALSNEGGGLLVFGMEDAYPHAVCGTTFAQDKVGALEDQIYTDIGMRVIITELYDSNNNRVLVFQIPKRPIGKIMKFEGVGLMRIGDSLREMSDEETFKILSEREPDFSALTHDYLSLHELDPKAINLLKEKYAVKSGNNSVKTLSTKQLLSDLELIKGEKVTYAALILLGKKEAIRSYLPQASVNLEFRLNPGAVTFDDRKLFKQAYLLLVDELWQTINLRNSKKSAQIGPYMIDIPFFNEEVIREAINNAMAHRDYTMEGEIVIKQSSEYIEITSPGGLPFGVTKDNLLIINSTPRNRLLADIMLKIGLVERSGQGVDKMFLNCIAEGKPNPDYSKTDYFQVNLRLSSRIIDEPFAILIHELQGKLAYNDKMGINDLIVLQKVRNKQHISEEEYKESIQKLLSLVFIIREKGERKGRFIFSEKCSLILANK